MFETTKDRSSLDDTHLEEIENQGSFQSSCDINRYFDECVEEKNAKRKKGTGKMLPGEYITGNGVILPGDINSLVSRFQLVCAERAAGNTTATTPEVVAILDELLRRRHISREEYNAMCKGLGC